MFNPLWTRLGWTAESRPKRKMRDRSGAEIRVYRGGRIFEKKNPFSGTKYMYEHFLPSSSSMGLRKEDFNRL